jgi:hypothetical protein
MNLKYFYKEALIKFNPKTVLFMNMGIHMPLCEAAKELGIKTIEVQHGAQKANTPIYNDWLKLPKNGYKGLPDYFAVWGELDKKHIDQVFQGTIKPIIVGCTWLDKSTNGKSTSYIKELFVNLRKKYQFIIVLTLQNQNKFPPDILNLIEKFDYVAWVIKTHPKWNCLNLELLKEYKNIVINDYIQHESIMSLLQEADAHVTRDSSSVYEANSIGVPSFVYSKSGYKMYSYELNDGTVQKISKLSDLLSQEIVEPGAFRAYSDKYKKNHGSTMLASINLNALSEVVQNG